MTTRDERKKATETLKKLTLDILGYIETAISEQLRMSPEQKIAATALTAEIRDRVSGLEKHREIRQSAINACRTMAQILETETVEDAISGMKITTIDTPQGKAMMVSMDDIRGIFE